MSGGDGMGGLLLVIMIVIVAIIAVAAAVPFAIALFASKKAKNHNARMMGALIASALGVVVGVLIVTATFFESTWSPPDELTFAIPNNFSHASVYVIEDPRVSREMNWRGTNRVPLMHRTATLDVPASGVVRVRSLQMGEVIEMPRGRTQRGEIANGSASRMAPPAISNGIMFRFDFGDPTSAPAAIESTEAALVRAVLAREEAR